MSSREVNRDEIYKGTVASLKNFGAFINLHDENGGKLRSSGLCHISQISSTRIADPSDVLKQNQEVYVRVLDVKPDGKISLTMKNIDQVTGEESFQQQYNEDRGRIRNRVDGNTASRPVKRKASPDKWEMSVMNKAFGAKRTMPQSNGKDDPFAEVNSEDEISDEEGDLEIEITNEEPPFLQGKTSRSGRELSPIRMVKAPEGSLNRSATGGSRFMKVAKAIKQKKKKAEEDKKRKEQKEQNSQDPFLSNGFGAKVADDAYESNAFAEWRKQTKNASYGKRTELSITEQRETLPVFQLRDKLLESVRENDFLVIVGETGSGKTTQITQYLAEDGFGDNGIIGCTQPRRVAAMSVAKRVAEEVGCKVGDEVGYTVRFDDTTSSKTQIKYMTDGMLEREALLDPDMKRYSVIMLDEAHERTIATDVLFALLKKAVSRRNGTLKVIVTSATLDSDKFSKYFNNCPIITIPGRTFPVEIFYSVKPEMDYIAATLESILHIHINNAPGDILVFLTGKEEIDTCCETLVDRMKVLYDQSSGIPELIILPIYSSLPSEMQSRIFDPTPEGKRKVILATNIAETSVTIDGIYYVIDPGFVKVNAYDPKLGMDSLIISPISKAQANQRAGRAGRTGPGQCYRLYTKSSYEFEMMDNTIPEIQRQNLSHTILMLKAMGIDDLLDFEFMDPPSENTMLTALEELYILDALDEEGHLTTIGKYMAYFPMEPLLAKTLIKSIEFNCSFEVLTIVSMLSVPEVFYRPKEKKEIADKMKAKFNDYNGDHLTLLNVYEKWEENNCSKTWCQDHFIHEKALRRARDVRKQLEKIMQQLDRQERRRESSIKSCRGDVDLVRKAFVSGFFKNCAKRSSEESSFKTIIEGTSVHIHPSSSLFKKSQIDYVIYHTLVLTTQEYMHCVTKIDPKWLVQYAPRFFKNADPSQLSSRKKAIKIQPLFDKFDPRQSWRISKGRR